MNLDNLSPITDCFWGLFEDGTEQLTPEGLENQEITPNTENRATYLEVMAGNNTPLSTNIDMTRSGGTSVQLTRNVEAPPPNSERAPIFNGMNVTEFLESYDEIVDYYPIEPERARKRFLRYVSQDVRELVESLPEYHENDPENYDKEAFYAALKKEFKHQDWESIKNSPEYLHQLVEKAEKEPPEIGLKEFVIRFNRVSSKVMANQGMDEVTRCRLFMRGLTDRARDRVLKMNPNFEPEDVTTYSYKDLFKAATETYEMDEKRQRMRETVDPRHSEQLEKHLKGLVKGHYGAMPKHVLPMPPEMDRTASAPVIPKIPATSTQNSTPPTVPPSNNAGNLTKAQRKAQQATQNAELDELTSKMKDLAIRAVTRDELKEALENQAERLVSALKPSQYSQRGNYGGYGRGRGGYSRGGYVNASYQPRQKYNEDPVVEEEHEAPTGNVSAVQNNWEERTCFACHGRDWKGEPTAIEHKTANNCPYMIDLMNRGCCHKRPGDKMIYKGKWEMGDAGIPFLFDRNRRWIDQILAALEGTEWDYFIERRPSNVANKKKEALLAEQERQKSQDTSGQTPQTILSRPSQVNHVCLSGEDGTSVDDYYPPANDGLEVMAAGRSQNKKNADKKDSTRQLWKDRERREAKLPHVRGSRGKANADPTIPMDMDDEDDDDEPFATPRPASQQRDSQTIENEEPEEEEPEEEDLLARPRRKKATAPLQKLNTDRKMIIQCMKTPDPAASLANKVRRDTAVVYKLVRMLQGVTEIYEGVLNPSKQTQKMIQQMEATRRQIEQDKDKLPPETVLSAVNRISTGKPKRTKSFDSLIEKGRVTGTPKVKFHLTGTKSTESCIGLLDTGAQVSLLPTEVGLRCGGTLWDVPGHHLSSATGTPFACDGYIKLKITVAEGVSCVQGFFLHKTVPKPLLGYPVIKDFKVSFVYQPSGAIDGIFHDTRGSRNYVQLTILPAIKKRVRFNQQKGAFDSSKRARVEELDSEDEELNEELQDSALADSDEEDF